jgi:YgiT-type zinc finger domain-containing protein
VEKRTPHCKLSFVKTLAASGKIRTTQQARQGAGNLGMTFSDMVHVVMCLQPTDFYKSMTTNLDLRSSDMKCPVCGYAELKQDTRDLAHTFKGETTLITKVEGSFCPSCHESLLDAKESVRVMKEMNAFNTRVISATLSSNI